MQASHTATQTQRPSLKQQGLQSRRVSTDENKITVGHVRIVMPCD